MKKKQAQFVFSCILLFLSAVLSVYLAFLLQKVIDSALLKSVKTLKRTVAITAGFMVADLTLSLLAKHFSTNYVQNTLEKMKSNRFLFIFSKPDILENKKVQKELSSFTTDVDLIEQNYVREKLNIFFYISQFILALLALISINWILTLSVALVSLLPAFVPSIFQGRLQRYQNEYSQNAEQYTRFTSECLHAKREILSYNQFDSVFKKYNEIDNTLEKSRRKTRFTNAAVGLICANLGFLSFLTALGIGSYFVIKGKMTFGYMIAAVQLMNSVMNPLNYLTNSLASYKSAKDVVKKFEETSEIAEQGNKIPSNFKNKIEISNLSFSYGEDNPVLKDVNLTLPRGKKIALIGPSGCGKSTLAKILAREISGFEGNITLDGIPIENIDIKRYREIVRFVRQDSFIFTDTIRENIAFFKSNYDDYNFESALHLSKVDSFAATSSELDRIITNTSGLSGGQKQRVIIARALLRNSPILILDEFTSALDLNIAQKIIQDVLQIEDITCLVITHQCDDKTLAMFDSVIKLNDINMI